jgi:hypothetical protein
METKRGHQKISYRRESSGDTLAAGDLQALEDILAKMIAAAYAREHPDLFRSFVSMKREH